MGSRTREADSKQLRRRRRNEERKKKREKKKKYGDYEFGWDTFGHRFGGCLV